MRLFSDLYMPRLRDGWFKRGAGTATLAGGMMFGLAGTAPALHAQAVSVNGGSIQGTITDPSGAVVPHAQITVTSPQTGYKKALTSDGAGLYTLGPLNPGDYSVAVTAPGYSTLTVSTVVKTNTVTSGNYKLAVGESTQQVEVSAGEIQVNTQQSSVSNVLTTKQIDTLPINGRNFLDLAQLEPGVQLQSGETFDPTKAGYSALSFNGQSGRTTRILLDGQDITDETVGTTIFNVSQGAVDQFQITRSGDSASADIGSSGHVLVSTRSGTNSFHGNLFYDFQDHRAGFAAVNGIDAPFQRNQFGGSIGGPILKDKLFFFANAERIKQDESSPIQLGTLFQASVGSLFPNVPAPYRETYSTGRVDYNAPHGIHLFARINYDVNSVVTSGNNSYDIYANRDNTPGIAGGADFVNGRFTHSFRGSYEKFHNLITDATGSGVYNPLQSAVLFRYASEGLYAGPNDLAPQSTYQSDKQARYDGTWTKGKHTINYGASLNDILQGGFASFFGLAPRITLNSSSLIGSDNPSDPIHSYNASAGVKFGNGLGYFTNIPTFGAPAGGSQDWRVGVYVGDSWKVTPQLVVNYGLRYQRDTGRTDNYINPIPCSAINTANFDTAPPCSGNQLILDQFGPGLGARISQPNFDFNPQLGFAYSLGSEGKTVISGGIGLYRENTVFNASEFDTPFKLAQGLFLDYSHNLCGGINSINIPGTGPVSTYNGENISDICQQPIAVSGPKFAGIQAEYQKGSNAVGASGNGSFIGNTLAIPAGNSAYSPNFKTPYSTQVNFSVQQQFGRGTVLTVSYLHSATVHISQTIDQNHVGDARFFNRNAAQHAIAAALATCGVGSLDAAIINCPGQTGGGPLTIQGLSAKGLDSGNAVYNGSPASANMATPDTGAAFPGQNAAVGNGFFTYPAGRSGYDALQVNLREQKAHPIRGIADSNFEASYALGRTVASSAAGADQFFTGNAWDYNNPTQYIGYSNLDRRNTISFGGSVTVAHGPEIGIIGHIYSAPPSNLLLDNTSGVAGQIFTSNVLGDGNTNQQLVPGTNPGSYMRTYNGGNLQTVINNYNAKYGSQLSPAGQTLVSSGLISAAQMQALGGVLQPIADVPQAKAITNPPFRQIDASVHYPFHIRAISEAFTIDPGVAMYNVANLGNYNQPEFLPTAGNGTLLNTADAGQANALNGPNDFSVKNQNRISRGAGTFDAGGPRSTEFQLKLDF